MKLIDSMLRCFRVAKVFRENSDKINCFSPNGEIVISSSDDDSIVLYHCQEGKPKRTLYSKIAWISSDTLMQQIQSFTALTKEMILFVTCSCMTTNTSGTFLDIAKGWWPCPCHLWMTLSFLGLLIRPFGSGISALLTFRVSRIYRASQFVLLIQKD